MRMGARLACSYAWVGRASIRCAWSSLETTMTSDHATSWRVRQHFSLGCCRRSSSYSSNAMPCHGARTVTWSRYTSTSIAFNRTSIATALPSCSRHAAYQSPSAPLRSLISSRRSLSAWLCYSNAFCLSVRQGSSFCVRARRTFFLLMRRLCLSASAPCALDVFLLRISCISSSTGMYRFCLYHVRTLRFLGSYRI